MATKVIMPALGMSQETGTLMAWLKREGETVTAGEPLMEIETDKTTAEVDAPASGILAGISAQPGDEVPVAQVIAWIVAPGEAAPDATTPDATAPDTAPASARPVGASPVAASPVAARVAAEHGVALSQVTARSGRIAKADVLAHIAAQSTAPRLQPASPKARRLAQEQGVALTAVAGTGPDGAVLAADLAASPALVPMSQPWRVMAQRLAHAWATIPHFTLKREVVATELVRWHQAAQAHAAERVTLTDLLVRATAVALRAHPRLNAAWEDGQIRLNEAIHIGLAVPIDDGLVVPVLPRTDQLTVAELAAARRGIVTRAKAGKLKLADLQGGTFTISNLGMLGIDEFQAIVNPPQAAILAVGRLVDKVIPVKGKPKVRPVMTLTLSCDHRVVDGARGAHFLETLVQLLTEPLSIL